MDKKFELTREYIDQLKEVIDIKDEKSAFSMMKGLHPADIAEILDELNPDESRFLFLLLESETASDVLIELEEYDREKILEAIPSEIIARQFIVDMDSDDAADVIGELSDDKKEEVLSHIDDLEQAGDIVDLLNYDEDTAGGLMAKEYVAVQDTWDVQHCINEIRRQAEEVEELFFVYVIDQSNKLRGIISLKQLLLAKPNEMISNIINRDIISVKTDQDAEEVAIIMDKYGLVAVPVVDQLGRLTGRITIDDVVDVIREEADKDYQLISGITSDVESSDRVFQLTKARLPWLLIGMFGGIIGANILGAFEEEIGIYPQLAFFIPLIAAMGGNVGIQSSSIVVQGLANKTLGFETTGKKLIKELSVGLVNGVICAAIIFGYNMLVHHSYPLTFSVSLSLITVIIFASVFGTFIPLLLNRFDIDPALATGPFITTTNDILGLFIYLIIGKNIFQAFAGMI